MTQRAARPLFEPKVIMAAVLAAVLPALLPVSARAEPAKRYDLDSISLQPAYVSASLLRQSSSLRAVAVSPPQLRSSSPGSRVVVAVGDAGAILRSHDDGETWYCVEHIRLDEPEDSTPFGHSKRRAAPPLPIPLCDFTDVRWASPRDVIVVGGGYEPVTGISRGVCVLSRDAGRTWYLADAHELPRLRQLRMGGPTTSVPSHTASAPDRGQRELAPGVLEVIGDPTEASGVDHFYSYDGGQTWVEDIRAARSSPDARDVSRHQPGGQTRTIETPSGPVTVNDLTAAGNISSARDRSPSGDYSPSDKDGPASVEARSGDVWQFAVGSHGRIWRRGEPSSPWRAVRGQGRGTAVVFVAASPGTVPWSLAGRESLHENRRTAILLDAAGRRTSSPSEVRRCRAAAAMFGMSDVNSVASDADRMRWLAEHRPAVVVLDDSLSPATQRSWAEIVDRARSRPFSQSANAAAIDWSGPQRVILTRRVASEQDSGAGRSSHPWYRHEGDPRWQRAWNHTSVLRGNALLGGPGVLANDLAIDALMLAAPQQTVPFAIELATFEDTSGSVRRDIALAAGLTLTEGQSRQSSETFTASNRRLQISTARMSQTRRLHDELFKVSRRSPAAQSRLNDTLDQLLTITAPEDRTRLLWEALAASMSSAREFPLVREMLLSQLSRHGQPAAVRRWAELTHSTLASSGERRGVTSLEQLADLRQHESRVLGNVAGHLDDRAGHDESRNSRTGHTARRQTLSPFQIAPVSYEEEITTPNPEQNEESQQYAEIQPNTAFEPNREYAPRTASAIVLVPESEPVAWQPIRRWNSLPAPLGADTHAAPLAGVNEDDSSIPARINWDYHPVVMAARGISPQQYVSGDPVTGSQFGTDVTRKTSRYLPPSTDDRPLLDGRDDDACWAFADHWRGDAFDARCIADEDYLYFAISAADHSRLRLSLDCDGDYFTAIRFEIKPDGARRVSVDGVGAISPVWYSARAIEINSTKADATDQRLLTEIAIARSSLSAPVCRVNVSVTGPHETSLWEVMPKASEWHPQR